MEWSYPNEYRQKEIGMMEVLLYHRYDVSFFKYSSKREIIFARFNIAEAGE